MGGYDPINALRMVYDSSYSFTGSFTRNSNVFPNTVSTQSVDLQILIPEGAIGIEAMRLWNNKIRVPCTYSILDGCKLLPIHLLGKEYRGLVNIRIDLSELGEFTHLEMQFEIDIDPIYAEWNKINYAENLQVLDNMGDVSVVLSTRISNVSMHDIITESVYKRRWKITSFTKSLDRQVQIQGWEASARLLQTYELANTLPTRQDRVWYWGNIIRQQPVDINTNHEINPYQAHYQTKFR